ncbi:hypothetical protein HY311_00895 [Candidatus Nomurabacteria bacterium]|nr:hypothetical protein [Candidatus Nomurabacteria bacterium]
MLEIKDLLARFSIILSGEEGKKDVVRKVISETIGVDINSKDIKIKNGTIYLNIKPIYKNEILLKQEKILLKLEESFGKRSPTAIL